MSEWMVRMRDVAPSSSTSREFAAQLASVIAMRSSSIVNEQSRASETATPYAVALTAMPCLISALSEPISDSSASAQPASGRARTMSADFLIRNMARVVARGMPVSNAAQASDHTSDQLDDRRECPT